MKALEEYGIGRPEHLRADALDDPGPRLRRAGRPAAAARRELASSSTTCSSAHFPEIVDVGFTAQMEEQLDDIADRARRVGGSAARVLRPVRRDRSTDRRGRRCPRSSAEARADRRVLREVRQGAGDQVRPLRQVHRLQRLPGVPERQVVHDQGRASKCPKCGGEMVEKKTPRKRHLLQLRASIPKCDFAVWNRPLPQAEQPCKSCGGLLVEAAAARPSATPAARSSSGSRRSRPPRRRPPRPRLARRREARTTTLEWMVSVPVGARSPRPDPTGAETAPLRRLPDRSPHLATDARRDDDGAMT